MLSIRLDKALIEKLQKIKAIFFDVDGVLTDGSIIYLGDKEEIKSFNVKDGQILKHLRENGIKIGAITGRSSDAVKRRCEELKLDFFGQGISDKYQFIDERLSEMGMKWEEVCYIGDDIIDLKALKMSAFSAAPEDALEYIKSEVDYVCNKKGGHGVVREVADMVLHAQGKLENIIRRYC